MDFLYKKQTIRQSPIPRIFSLAVAMSMIFMSSGCTSQTAKINNPKATLLSEPVVDEKLTQQDFAFPSQLPSLMRGREIYFQKSTQKPNNCIACHAQSYWQTPKVKQDLAYTTPIDLYLMLSTGKAPDYKDVLTPERKKLLPANHPAFRNEINRDDRWAVIFYTRYLAGAGDIKSADPKTDVAAIFGGNCAVCHGTKGQADGPLYTGKTGNHELHDATLVHNLMPAPANFRQPSRLYNRTDAQLFKYLCEGIYPSAMPSWYGNVNIDKDTGKITYIFDEKLLTNLVRHVRFLGYSDDLKSDLPEVISPPPGLAEIQSCRPVASNRPWTNGMKNNKLNKTAGQIALPADSITGGMVHVNSSKPVPVIHQEGEAHGSTTVGGQSS